MEVLYLVAEKQSDTNKLSCCTFTTKLYDYENPYEERRPLSDKAIASKSLNGKKDDHALEKPWDWNYPFE